jgi:XTP/dITP diphosphohydrolase
MGESGGRITEEYFGNGGFGYDPLFYVKEFDKTLAELTAEEKNKVSHRANALREFAKIFKERIK